MELGRSFLEVPVPETRKFSEGVSLETPGDGVVDEHATNVGFESAADPTVIGEDELGEGDKDQAVERDLYATTPHPSRQAREISGDGAKSAIEPKSYAEIYSPLTELSPELRSALFTNDAKLIPANVRALAPETTFGEAIERPNALHDVTTNVLTRAELLTEAAAHEETAELQMPGTVLGKMSDTINLWKSLQEKQGDAAREVMDGLLMAAAQNLAQNISEKTQDQYVEQWGNRGGEENPYNFLLRPDIAKTGYAATALSIEAVNAIHEQAQQLRNNIFREQILEAIDAQHDPKVIAASRHAWANFCSAVNKLQMEKGPASNAQLVEALAQLNAQIEERLQGSSKAKAMTAHA